MKQFTYLLAIIVILLGTSCSGVYWEQKKRTANGTYTYYKPAWGEAEFEGYSPWTLNPFRQNVVLFLAAINDEL